MLNRKVLKKFSGDLPDYEKTLCPKFWKNSCRLSLPRFINNFLLMDYCKHSLIMSF